MDTLSSSFDTILVLDHLSTPDELVSLHNSLNNIISCLFLMKSQSVTFSQTAPWFTPQLCALKPESRQLEWPYRKTGLNIHKEMYKTHIIHYKDLISTTKSAYYSSLIPSNEGNTKTLFSLVGNIFHPPPAGSQLHCQ